MTVFSQIYYTNFQTSLVGILIRHNVRVKQNAEVKKNENQYRDKLKTSNNQQN